MLKFSKSLILGLVLVFASKNVSAVDCPEFLKKGGSWVRNTAVCGANQFGSNWKNYSVNFLLAALLAHVSVEAANAKMDKSDCKLCVKDGILSLGSKKTNLIKLPVTLVYALLLRLAFKHAPVACLKQV